MAKAFFIVEKNNETKYDYDYRGNLIKVTEPMGNSIKYSYDCNDNLSEIIKNNGSIKYTYDGCKNLVLETDELGNKKEYTYDCFGNVTKENNDIGSVSYAYDLNGNNIRKTIITGKHIENYNYSYDNNNELIEFSSDVNSKNNTVNITRDALSNIVSVCDGNKTVKYGYDKDNNNTSVVYPNGDKVSYEYNNGKIKTIKTLNDKFEYEYNSFNEVISKKSNHINEKYEYDKLGRLIKIYESDALRESLKYDTLNNLISKEEYKGSLSKKTEYSYDKNGRITNETTEKGDEKTTTKYQYDTNSNLVKETKGNKVVEYSYDNGDRLSSRVESINSSKTGTNNQKTIEYNYDVLGDLLSEKSDSYNKTYSYNADGKLTSSYVLLDIKKNDKGNKTDIETTEKIDNTYLYNALGLLIEKTSSRKTDYKYKNNPLGYVKSDIETKNYIKDEQYLYDYTNANPTVLSSEISVSSTDEDDYYYEKNILSILKYSDENTITSTDKQYKINSNYVYEGDKKISVSLNVDGEINTKTIKKTTSLFGKTVVKEDGDNNSDKYSTEYTLITDSKGSVLKALDLSGNTAGEVSYGSFGNVEDIDIKESDDILAEELKTSDILPSYTSYVYSDELKSLQDEKISSTVYGDSESKDLGDETGYNKYTTWYAYERFYSTIDKRFISKDPVVGSIDEPSRVNSYIYAGDNPLTYVDRDGRSFTCEITNNRFFKKAAELVGKISDVADKVANVVKPIVDPIVKTVNYVTEKVEGLPTWAKVGIGVIGAAIAITTGVGATYVATTMAKSAIGGAIFNGAIYGVSSLVTGHFDKTELINSMLNGAADMFMVSGVMLGAKGVVDCVVRNRGRIKSFFAGESGEISRGEGEIGFGSYNFKDGIDVDLRGKGTVDDALEEAFRKVGESKENFTVTKWAEVKNNYGKSVPVEWTSQVTGAQVNIDAAHYNNIDAPQIPHVGYKTGGKRKSGGKIVGHIFVDDVTYFRPQSK